MEEKMPHARILSRPQVEWRTIVSYFENDMPAGTKWLDRQNEPDAATLAEFSGRLCYQSWEPGANPNVTRVRTDRGEYFRNVLKSRHGSILEHLTYSFLITDVSRVATHELVRHRPGTGISQESGRFVRPTELDLVIPPPPDKSRGVGIVLPHVVAALDSAMMQLYTALDWNSMTFSEKKRWTSWLRRFMPEGRATCLVWSANVRTLRHTIEVRTAKGAEDEIRDLFQQIGMIMVQELPELFEDFTVNEDGEWVPEFSKV